MNYLVTLNIGDYISDNTKLSFMDACKRWGVSYYEIKDKHFFKGNMCFSKYFGIYGLLNEKKDVRGVLYLDGDMLIRDDAPNPFDLFNNKRKIYVVKDFDDKRWSKESESYMSVKLEVSTPWVREIHKKYNWNMTEDDFNNFEKWFFNAGMFLLYFPQSLPELELFMTNVTDDPINNRNEQAFWNYVVKCRNKSEYIDSTWNRINPECESGIMEDYIYHFTGMFSYHHKVKNKQKTFNWHKK